MTYLEVTPIGWTKRAVTSTAERLAKAWGVAPRDQLEAVTARLGGTIEYQDILSVDQTKDGSILIDDVSSFKIFVPDYVSFERNRFTIAHELGHYVLHYIAKQLGGKKVKAARASGPNQQRAEREADWFAAALLMPQALFLEEYKKSEGNLTSVARHFGVSTQAAKWQLEYLNANADPTA